MPNGSFQLPVLPRFGDPTTQLQNFATRDYVDNAILAAATASGYALRGSANTFTAANTFSANGALSAPAVSFTGTPVIGGTTVTTTPLVKIGAGTDGAYNTSGEMFGINAPAGFGGYLQHWLLNGSDRAYITNAGSFVSVTGNFSLLTTTAYFGIGSDTFLSRKAAANIQLGAADAASPVAQTLSVHSVVAGTSNTAGANWTQKGSAGTGTGAGGSIVFQVAPAGGAGSSQNAYSTILTLTANSSLTAIFGGSVLAAATAAIGWSGSRTLMRAPADSIITLLNSAETDFNRLQFGGTTSSFPAIKRSTTTLQAVLADDSGFAAVQSLYDRFGSGSPESAVTAPVGAVYHRTDGGAGTSFYVKESGTGNTGWVAK